MGWLVFYFRWKMYALEDSGLFKRRNILTIQHTSGYIFNQMEPLTKKCQTALFSTADHNPYSMLYFQHLPWWLFVSIEIIALSESFLPSSSFKLTQWITARVNWKPTIFTCGQCRCLFKHMFILPFFTSWSHGMVQDDTHVHPAILHQLKPRYGSKWHGVVLRLIVWLLCS